MSSTRVHSARHSLADTLSCLAIANIARQQQIRVGTAVASSNHILVGIYLQILSLQGTQANTCPTSSSDRTAFERDRLEEVDPGAYYCSLRIAGTGEVWHQVGSHNHYVQTKPNSTFSISGLHKKG